MPQRLVIPMNKPLLRDPFIDEIRESRRRLYESVLSRALVVFTDMGKSFRLLPPDATIKPLGLTVVPAYETPTPKIFNPYFDI